MTVEEKVSKHIRFLDITITMLSKGSGVSVGILYRSLNDKIRRLRTDEFFNICDYLKINPLKFAPDDYNKGNF